MQIGLAVGLGVVVVACGHGVPVAPVHSGDAAAQSEATGAGQIPAARGASVRVPGVRPESDQRASSEVYSQHPVSSGGVSGGQYPLDHVSMRLNPSGKRAQDPSIDGAQQQWTLLLEHREIRIVDGIFDVVPGVGLVLRSGRVFLVSPRMNALAGEELFQADEAIVLVNGHWVSRLGQLVSLSAQEFRSLNARVLLRDCEIVLENSRVMLGDRMFPLSSERWQQRLGHLELRRGLLVVGGRPLVLGEGGFVVLPVLPLLLKDGDTAEMEEEFLDDDLEDAWEGESDGQSESSYGSSDEELAPVIFDAAAEAAFANDQVLTKKVVRQVPEKYLALDLEARRYAFGRLGLRSKRLLRFADWVLSEPQPEYAFKQFERCYSYAYFFKLQLAPNKAQDFAYRFAQVSTKAFENYKKAYKAAIATKKVSRQKARNMADEAAAPQYAADLAERRAVLANMRLHKSN